jgi:hypothetical protein
MREKGRFQRDRKTSFDKQYLYVMDEMALSLTSEMEPILVRQTEPDRFEIYSRTASVSR